MTENCELKEKICREQLKIKMEKAHGRQITDKELDKAFDLYCYYCSAAGAF